ncbi:hypothetical protein EGW08_010124 [Elysia chlorotica]|uniref:t-SNARE coiled-coil homology domain-containing protein n=1 Tax=Elysia chlorotica TaxID=188477 RepID=A0A3S0ZLY8_ELYCH|nr:hypothetical protein EGW08_010124 [Elysia chlorotica]
MTTYAPAPVTTDLHVAPQHTDASNSWEQLQENIVELNDLVHHFADEVEQQGETLNTIEENIDSAEINVKEGTTSLAQASKYKSAMLPVVGAVVGGMVGGPIGFVAGMKLGGLAGVVGGAAGFAGGRMLKKHQSKIDQVELENLSDKRSISITETNDSTLAEMEGRGTTHCGSESSTFKQLSSNQEDSNQGDGAGQAQGGIASITDIYSGVASSFKSLFTPQSDAQKEKS